MPIKVCGVHNVLKHIDGADFIVAIRDPKRKSIVHNPDVFVRFEDTEYPDDRDAAKMLFAVKTVLAAVDAKQVSLSDNIVVHCEAGVSRSSAMAWLILIKLGMDYKEAFRLLISQHPNIWPNTEVLSYGASLLKLPQEFRTFVAQVTAEISDKRGGFLGYGG